MQQNNAICQAAEARQQAMATSLKNLEVQLGEIARVLSDRPNDMPRASSFKKHIKVITLRSGKEVKAPEIVNQPTPRAKDVLMPKKEDGNKPMENSEKTKEDLVMPNTEHNQLFLTHNALRRRKWMHNSVSFLNFSSKFILTYHLLKVIVQMPKYAKSFRFLLFNKKLEELSMVMLNEECSPLL